MKSYIFNNSKFKNYRKKLITQQNMALTLNVSRITIQNLEYGKYQPSLNLYMNIIDLLELPYNDLIVEVYDD
jgi:DNA-binding XRE family transcriptional regulator